MKVSKIVTIDAEEHAALCKAFEVMESMACFARAKSAVEICEFLLDQATEDDFNFSLPMQFNMDEV